MYKKAQSLIRARLAEVSRPLNTALEPAVVRNSPRHQISQTAWLRQSKGRWYTTHSNINTIRRFSSTGASGNVKHIRSAFPKSTIGTAVNQLTTRAPFASTLRPNLTAGAFSRTAGGYSLGGGRVGGIRYFSHTPAGPAQVLGNVSTAIRAFYLSGRSAQFDGISPAGNKRYRSITNLQKEASRKMQENYAPGSFVDFNINPTVTALTPLGAIFSYGSAMKCEVQTLNTEGLLEALSVDFARALKDLAAVVNDLKRLSSLGDLSITLEGTSVLRVHFRGCDMESVERLCEELGIQRGIVHQDADFDASLGGRMALLFPFAPTSERTLSSPGASVRSEIGHSYDYCSKLEDSLRSSSPEGYETMRDFGETESMYFSHSDQCLETSRYEGLEGIYRFLEECDNHKRMS